MSVPSNNIVFQLTDASASLKTLQCDLDDFTYTSSRSIDKRSTFCAVEKSPGSVDNKITMAGVWNDASGASHATLSGLKDNATATLYKYGPNGSGSGEVLISGVAFVTDYEIHQAADGTTEFSATLEVDGNDVETTWS
jgi:predicted secreted protein